MSDNPTSKTVTVLTAAKITELTTKFPGLGEDTFVHERDYNQAENGRVARADQIEAMASVGIRQEREIERLLAINMALINANKSLADMAVEMQSSRVETTDRIEHLEFVLRGFYWDQVDYIKRNHLGGMNNHWMRATRIALGIQPDDPIPSVEPSEPRMPLEHYRTENGKLRKAMADLMHKCPRCRAEAKEALSAMTRKAHHPRCELMQPHGHEPPKCTCPSENGE